MFVRRVRVLSALVWVAGIAGMIVSSIRGNNNGWVISCGMATALASLILFTVSAATGAEPIEVFDEVRAEALEGDVQALIDGGADEEALRTLVRDAMRLGRRR